jgi:Na+-translocating ferredoxin:NAD+ oxidoreductase RnfC subunit
MSTLSEQLKRGGVVGAGGGGFPACVKAEAQAEFMLANGAECEPLLHKDFELMVHYPAEMVSGMKLMMEAVKASRGKFGIKEKNQEAVGAVEPHLKGTNIDMVLLGDFYPSGDEYELVYIATGRLIPPAGIPLEVGCVVNNVETLYNVHFAAQGVPVTQKFLSVSGAVRQPKSFWAPVGVSFRELIEKAGGATAGEFGFFISGMMMGRLSFDLDDVVTKTTCGLIVLPRDHYLVERKARPLESMNRIGKSACDQCSYCTEFCPRYLLGYNVQPHKVMRSLGFTTTGNDIWNQFAELCCACGLCTLYACPEDLYPKEACDQSKAGMRIAGIKYVQPTEPKVHPMKEGRRVPQALLRRRLKVEQYDTETPFDPEPMKPKSVKILLKQHAGKPASTVVKAGGKVRIGDTVGSVTGKDLGADVHASIAGRVTAVTDSAVEISA